ncbi:MAG: hypothetical protein VKK04_08975 [Synechococcales bacterium]|nr:hypothetical protein [Synechococcales bacterium]
MQSRDDRQLFPDALTWGRSPVTIETPDPLKKGAIACLIETTFSPSAHLSFWKANHFWCLILLLLGT